MAAKATLLDSKQILLDVEYRDRDLIRAVPGAKWIRDRLWRCPRTWAVCLALRGIFGERLEIGPDLEEWAWQELNGRVRPALEAREGAMQPDPTPITAVGSDEFVEMWNRLRNYQQWGADFLSIAESAILADEPGLGKTFETIATLEQSNSYPALIVTPKAVVPNWAESFARWAPHRSVLWVSSANKTRAFKQLDDYDVIVTNWEMLRTSSRIAGYGSIRLTDAEKQEKPLNRPWGALVADEAHKSKDPKAKQTRALWAIGESAERRIALTGTPVANVPQDLWSLLHFVDPAEWPSRTAFLDRYCLVTSGYWGGIEVLGLNPQTKDELYASLDARMLRRPKKLVLRDLPDKEYVVRYTEMVPKQARAYKAMVENMVAWLDDEHAVTAFSPLVVHGRLRQFAAAFAEMDDDGKITLAEPSGKIDGLVDFLEEVGDEPLVVFSESKQLIDLACLRLDKKHVTFARYTGDENDRKRQTEKKRFLDGEAQVILITLGAGAEGLDGLQARASVVCFLQRGQSELQNSQAEDRLHRVGQHNSVLVVDFITPGTVEETVVLPSLQDKKVMLEEVARDKEAIRRLLLNG